MPHRRTTYNRNPGGFNYKIKARLVAGVFTVPLADPWLSIIDPSGFTGVERIYFIDECKRNVAVIVESD